MNRDWFSRVLDSIADRGRELLNRGSGRAKQASPEALCVELLSGRGEASGMAIARDLIHRYDRLDEEGRIAFFMRLNDRFGPNAARLREAAAAYVADGSPDSMQLLQQAAEPPRQELFRRINMAPTGTAALVRMRGDLRRLLPGRPALAPVDRDMQHMLASWFNRGFLSLQRIDWNTPAVTLEKLIQYESVHAIRSWEDLHRRLRDDRRCFAFVHPALRGEPLIFVEVALTIGIPGRIQPLIDPASAVLSAGEADSVVFYSINNTQPGLSGISFGNFLIKQVVAELKSEFRSLDNFVTLSPMLGFAASLRRAAANLDEPESRAYDRVVASHQQEVGGTLSNPGSLVRFVRALDEGAGHAVERFAPLLNSLALAYLTLASCPSGGSADPVARFHLSNGAYLDRIRPFGDVSDNGLRQSFGTMVNYRYDPDKVEVNHEQYVGRGVIPMSRAVARDFRRVKAAWRSVTQPQPAAGHDRSARDGHKAATSRKPA